MLITTVCINNFRAVFKFDGPRIICTERGQCFEDFRQQFGDNERAFGYIRIQMGDEMSKRKKFIFLTWIGQDVGVIQRAKMSTDKALIKDVLNVSSFSQKKKRKKKLVTKLLNIAFCFIF